MFKAVTALKLSGDTHTQTDRQTDTAFYSLGFIVLDLFTVSQFISGSFAEFSDLNIFLVSQTIPIPRKVLPSFLFE